MVKNIKEFSLLKIFLKKFYNCNKIYICIFLSIYQSIFYLYKNYTIYLYQDYIKNVDNFYIKMKDFKCY